MSWNWLGSSHSSRIVLRATMPWRREFREDLSFVSGVLGPRDLAPLAREAADFSFDGIRFGLRYDCIPLNPEVGLEIVVCRSNDWLKGAKKRRDRRLGGELLPGGHTTIR